MTPTSLCWGTMTLAIASHIQDISDGHGDGAWSAHGRLHSENRSGGGVLVAHGQPVGHYALVIEAAQIVLETKTAQTPVTFCKCHVVACSACRTFDCEALRVNRCKRVAPRALTTTRSAVCRALLLFVRSSSGLLRSRALQRAHRRRAPSCRTVTQAQSQPGGGTGGSDFLCRVRRTMMFE